MPRSASKSSTSRKLSDCVGSQARFRSARVDDVCVFRPRQGERFRAPARAACGLDTFERHRLSLTVRSMLWHGPAPGSMKNAKVSCPARSH
jgi:hypothetical protein